MWLNEQIQFQFAVNPTYTFMVPSEPFHIMQIQQTQPTTPVLAPLGQSNQPILNLFRAPRFLSVFATTERFEYAETRLKTVS